jgi:putative phosphoribosyl transferase
MDQAVPDVSAELPVRVTAGSANLEGNISIPEGSRGIVLFAHGSGSGRSSPRNRFVAHQLRTAGLATLLVDLLGEREEAADKFTAQLRFNISLLADRIVGATAWLEQNERTIGLPVGYFGASTGGGAALVAAARCPNRVEAIVSRGGRPDLAEGALSSVRAPTLLIVGGDDEVVIGLNKRALGKLAAPVKKLVIVPGASHLFEEPGKLEEVARLATEWFVNHIGRNI